MGAAGFKAENFADVSAGRSRLLLGGVTVEILFSGPLGLEVVFWDEELGKV